MRKKHYLPRALNKRAQWLRNFAQGFEKIAPAFGHTTAEMDSVKNDAAMLSWVAQVQEIMRSSRKSFTAFKDMINEGRARKQQLALPHVPTLPAPPTPVAPGIFTRVGKLVQRIKCHKLYSVSIGQKLGVIGAERNIDTYTVRPTLKAKTIPGKLEVHFSKSQFHGIDLLINKGDGKGFQSQYGFTHSPIILNVKLPEGQRSAVWQLMALYRKGNYPIGLPSHIVEVVVSV